MMGSRDPSKKVAISPQKQEACTSEDASKTTSRTSFASTPWFKLKDPRVVRVSRAMGGKDRHSKVCTIRGLRDRRVRLSVPTAIQLYDLQDRLGLSQPSKVVDWLLDAAKQEIDGLPPLPMQPFHSGQHPIFHQYSSLPSAVPSSLEIDHSLSSNRELGLTPSGMSWYEGNDSSKSSRHKCLNGSEGASRSNEEEKQEVSERQAAKQLVLPSNFSARAADNPSNIPYGSSIYHHLEPSIGIPNFPRLELITPQRSSEDPRSFNFVQTPSTLSTISQTHSYFPLQFMTPSGAEMDPRHVNQFQSMVMSSGLQNFSSNSHDPPLDALNHHHSTVRVPVISFNVNSRVVPSQTSSGNEMDRD